jgi:hypothetical protein
MKFFGDREVTGTPLWEWRFSVSEIKVNDSKFDGDILEVRLDPDTAVSDLRHDVSYRVGDEAAFSDQLAALAKDAMQPELASSLLDSGGRRWWLIGLNICIVSSLIALWVFKSKTVQ